MNILIILLLLFPICSYLLTRCLPDKYLLNRRWLSILFLVISGLIGLGIFIVLLLINMPDYVQRISWTWANIAGHSLQISLLLNNFSGLLLALWALGSLIFAILTATDFFSPDHFRENITNLALGTLAVNGLILANDFLSLIFFWALIDLIIYRVVFRKINKASESYFPDIMVIGGHILLILVAFSLFKICGTFRFDLIIEEVLSGKVDPQQLILPGSMLILVGILRIYSPFFRYQFNSQTKMPISDEFILFCGLMPSGLFLVLKLFPIMPQIFLTGLMIFSGISVLIFLIIHLAKTGFNQLLHLNTIFLISLLIITIGLGTFPISASLLFILFMTNFMLIILAQDFQPMSDSANFSIALPFRLIAWLSLIGLPISLAFNTRLLLLQASLTLSSNKPIHGTIISALLVLNYFLNVVVVFRIFLKSGWYEPKHRKIDRVTPLTHCIIAGISIVCLYLFFTLPNFNPLTTELRFFPLFSIQGSQPLDYSQFSSNSLIIYSAILLIGLVVGFITAKYFKAEKFSRWLTEFSLDFRRYSMIPVANFSQVVARKIGHFDTVLFSRVSQSLMQTARTVILFINRINGIGAQQITKLKEVPEKYLNRILDGIFNLKFQVLIGIVLSILIITVLICIL
ncbi:MAG TPA: hypothetical protein PK386_01950 [Candidatus Marinimicrobia bacterium]|nr:hypothetical protein [Candidatus Neomarinimicrobiota bacterium]